MVASTLFSSSSNASFRKSPTPCPLTRLPLSSLLPLSFRYIPLFTLQERPLPYPPPSPAHTASHLLFHRLSLISILCYVPLSPMLDSFHISHLVDCLIIQIFMAWFSYATVVTHGRSLRMG